jgi:hypothetical protein
MGWIDSVKPLRVGQQAAGALGGQIELSGGSRGSGAKEHGDALAGSKGKGLDGLVAEPAGSPAMVSWTLAEKPFWALMEMLTSELVPPCETVKDVAEARWKNPAREEWSEPHQSRPLLHKPRRNSRWKRRKVERCRRWPSWQGSVGRTGLPADQGRERYRVCRKPGGVSMATIVIYIVL